MMGNGEAPHDEELAMVNELASYSTRIREAAVQRWLKTEEILCILTNFEKLGFEVCRQPIRGPTHGMLVIFDRRITRNFKDDQVPWVKKNKKNRVREDHVKLQLQKVNVVYGTYAHGEKDPLFHRRCYRLAGAPNEHYIHLVHYRRDVKQKLAEGERRPAAIAIQTPSFLVQSLLEATAKGRAEAAAQAEALRAQENKMGIENGAVNGGAPETVPTLDEANMVPPFGMEMVLDTPGTRGVLDAQSQYATFGARPNAGGNPDPNAAVGLTAMDCDMFNGIAHDLSDEEGDGEVEADLAIFEAVADADAARATRKRGQPRQTVKAEPALAAVGAAVAADYRSGGEAKPSYLAKIVDYSPSVDEPKGGSKMLVCLDRILPEEVRRRRDDIGVRIGTRVCPAELLEPGCVVRCFVPPLPNLGEPKRALAPMLFPVQVVSRRGDALTAVAPAKFQYIRHTHGINSVPLTGAAIPLGNGLRRKRISDPMNMGQAMAVSAARHRRQQQQQQQQQAGAGPIPGAASAAGTSGPGSTLRDLGLGSPVEPREAKIRIVERLGNLASALPATPSESGRDATGDFEATFGIRSPMSNALRTESPRFFPMRRGSGQSAKEGSFPFSTPLNLVDGGGLANPQRGVINVESFASLLDAATTPRSRGQSRRSSMERASMGSMLQDDVLAYFNNMDQASPTLADERRDSLISITSSGRQSRRESLVSIASAGSPINAGALSDYASSAFFRAGENPARRMAAFDETLAPKGADGFTDEESIDVGAVSEADLQGILDGMLVRVVDQLVDLEGDPAGEGRSAVDLTWLANELNAADESGNCLLHYCCAFNISKLLGPLLRYGASMDVRNDDGDTPLHLACRAGHLPIVEELLSNGAAAEPRNLRGQRALEATMEGPAPESRKREILTLLVQATGDGSRQGKATASSAWTLLESVEGRRKQTSTHEPVMQEAFKALSLHDKCALQLSLHINDRKKGRSMNEPFSFGGGAAGGTRPEAELENVISQCGTEPLDRAMSKMSEEERRQLEREAHVISRNFKAWFTQKQYMNLKSAARTLQTAWRGRRDSRGNISNLVANANLGNVKPPQSKAPGSGPYKRASTFDERAAVRLQAMARGALTRMENEQVKRETLASLKIQRALLSWRMKNL